VCFFYLHARLRAHWSPAFPAPSVSGGVIFQAELARITRRDREAIWLHMYVDAYGGLFETLNRRQWIAKSQAMDRVATRQIGVSPAIIEHQTRRNSAATACSFGLWQIRAHTGSAMKPVNPPRRRRTPPPCAICRFRWRQACRTRLVSSASGFRRHRPAARPVSDPSAPRRSPC
jgi:hypothetical protein